jgi:polysaccharide biosynthesis/export protein
MESFYVPPISCLRLRIHYLYGPDPIHGFGGSPNHKHRNGFRCGSDKPNDCNGIKESASQNISVIGEVHHPGVYPVTGSRTLLDVLSLAGGLTDVADPNIHIKRRSGVENKVAAKLNGSDAGALSSAETTVYPGDSIVVPRAGIVYVLGDVARPGGFVMRDSGKITLLQVMAEAGGTLPTASPSHLVLLRKEKENSTATKKLDLGKIARGREADVELQANDIIFVPNAKLKSALRASGTLASTASAISTVAIYGLM